ncbi:MAG: nucleoside kinase [Eubacteriales bacterium]|nr:nucleoside kinase [Eubacteriales bacterium]
MNETHLNRDRQTVKLGLIKVIQELFPDDMLKTAYSIQEGVFCRLKNSILSTREVGQIGKRLNELVASNSPMNYMGKKGGYFQYRVDNRIVNVLYEAHNFSSMVAPFKIIPFSTGFIVDFGDAERGEKTPLIPPEKLASTYDKNQNWLRNIDMELISDVNKYIMSGRSFELLCIAEALHEKEISDIADMILQQRRALRVLLISGPSSAGKTTFSKRLATQLRVNGLRPVVLSLNDYFVNRDKTPLDYQGNYDFEDVEALDLKLLHDHILRLIKGEEIHAPIFDFVTGNRSEKTKKVYVGPDEILLMEGIHAVNPSILPDINRNVFFRIIVNALFGLNIDLINRVPETEVRLLRRIVRDDRFRGIPAERTIKQWDSVRRGEYDNLFKYQEDCDVMFNSSLLYEMNALRLPAEASLMQIGEDSPYYLTRERLLNLLTFFEPMNDALIPFNSILREFTGGSHYERQL